MKSVLSVVLGICLWSGVSSAGVINIYHNNENGTISPEAGATPYSGYLATSWIFGEMSVDPKWVGQPMSGDVVRIQNPTGVPINVGVMLGVWAADGVGGRPGTLLDIAYTNVLSYPFMLGSIIVYTNWLVPAGDFWMGYAFETVNSSTTAAEVNSLRFYLGDAPTIGVTNTFALLGDQIGFLGSNPSISSTPAGGYLSQAVQVFVPDVPEPSSVLLMATALVLFTIRFCVRLRIREVTVPSPSAR